MNVIPASDPLHKAACDAVDAMRRFWELKQRLQPGAVQWIETSDGELLLFTRSEYKQAIREAIAENIQDDIEFEQIELEDETGNEQDN